jgi:glycogen(starch) synthase
VRIVLVSQEYPPETAHGGIGTQTYLKAHGLAARGHEVHVVSHSTDADRHEYRDGHVWVTRIPGVDGRLPVHTEPVRWLSYSVEVAAAVAALQARAPLDVVDFPEWASEGYVHLLNRTAWKRGPTVVHLHGPLVMFADTMGWPEKDSELYRVGKAMEGTCLRLADAVFSSSRCSAEWCAQHHGLDAASVSILHTGVDTKHFRPRRCKSERPTVVFAGKVAKNKGADVLVAAACRLASEMAGLRLELLGRGDPGFIALLKARAVEEGFPDLLELPGFVSQQDLPARLSRAHVFAAPSVYEGGPGFVYLEAMACGLPVIACSGSGASEVVRPGENGFLIPPGDADALTAVLRELLSHQDVCESMGRKARQFVEAEADSERCLDRLERFYAAVAGGMS